MAGERSTGELIVMSRLLILQSKRMLLSSAEKALVERESPGVRQRVERLRGETARAHETYRKVVLDWAPANSAELCSVAVGGSADAVQSLANRLREMSGGLPRGEQLEFAADIACLEQIAMRWRRQVLTAA